MTPLQWHYLKVKSEGENNWKLGNSRCNQLKQWSPFLYQLTYMTDEHVFTHLLINVLII